jgi:hypothetical protein
MSKMSNDPMFGRPVKPGQNKPFKPTTGGPMPKFQMPGSDTQKPGGMGNDMRKPGGMDKNMARKQAIQKRFLNK